MKPCDHQCTSDCRRKGCNCACGEFHDVPEYRIKFNIYDMNRDANVVLEGSSYLTNEKRTGEPMFGLENLLEERAEDEFWKLMRAFRNGIQADYEKEHYPVDEPEHGED